MKTVIGYGSPNKQGTNAVHGAPLGADETAATRQALGWDYEPFEIPEQVSVSTDNISIVVKDIVAFAVIFGCQETFCLGKTSSS